MNENHVSKIVMLGKEKAENNDADTNKHAGNSIARFLSSF